MCVCVCDGIKKVRNGPQHFYITFLGGNHHILPNACSSCESSSIHSRPCVGDFNIRSDCVLYIKLILIESASASHSSAPSSN